MATVLVTGVGGASGIGAVRALGETTTHDVVGVDMDPDAAGIYLADAGRAIPPADDPKWGAALRTVVDDHGVDVVVPTVDEELTELDALPDDLPVVAPRPAVVGIALDKYATYRRLDAAGHSVPRTWLASEADAIPEAAYPLVRKPRRGRGSRGIERVESPAALSRSLEAASRPADEVLFQTLVEGTEFTTSVVSTADDRLLSVVPKEAIEKEGSTVKGVTRRQPAVRESCRDIAATLSPAGPMNVQQIVADDGTPYTIEINPRFSSTACLTVEAGVDELDLLIRDALGESVPAVPEYDAGVYFLRYDNHVFVDGDQFRSEAGES
ncbi:ATP-grasp domain-containing protein [Haloarcula onubensis]|uniref:ATP-grasp domain-containing protein n=1 Tax=Haloarcula onubensis TaxID=2950539 RepID=A0ABU2FLF6_9EURY|nr:ATP-grasp domain-containing protein [Halomicroarcula sp. S3CR25-11]MDS0281595.1 ATP-grasp domain-containing protein [Halomicroarcula sp. S3CR25-11]